MSTILLIGNPVMSRCEEMAIIAEYSSLDEAQQAVNDALLPEVEEADSVTSFRRDRTIG